MTKDDGSAGLTRKEAQRGERGRRLSGANEK
jgi:hypothetical protein